MHDCCLFYFILLLVFTQLQLTYSATVSMGVVGCGVCKPYYANLFKWCST